MDPRGADAAVRSGDAAGNADDGRPRRLADRLRVSGQCLAQPGNRHRMGLVRQDRNVVAAGARHAVSDRLRALSRRSLCGSGSSCARHRKALARTRRRGHRLVRADSGDRRPPAEHLTRLGPYRPRDATLAPNLGLSGTNHDDAGSRCGTVCRWRGSRDETTERIGANYAKETEPSDPIQPSRPGKR